MKPTKPTIPDSCKTGRCAPVGTPIRKRTHQLTISEIEAGSTYWCKRCKTTVKGGKCNCTESPSPWELVRKPRVLVDLPDDVPVATKPPEQNRLLWIMLILALLALYYTTWKSHAQGNRDYETIEELLKEIDTLQNPPAPKPRPPSRGVGPTVMI